MGNGAGAAKVADEAAGKTGGAVADACAAGGAAGGVGAWGTGAAGGVGAWSTGARESPGAGVGPGRAVWGVAAAAKSCVKKLSNAAAAEPTSDLTQSEKISVRNQ